MHWEVSHAGDPSEKRRLLLRCAPGRGAGGENCPGERRLRYAGQHHPQRQRGGPAGTAGGQASRYAGPGVSRRHGDHPLSRRDKAGAGAAGGNGCPVRQRHLPQRAAHSARRVPGGRSRAHSPGHRGAPPPGGHGRGQLVGPDSGVFRAGGTGAVAAGGPRPAESALDGSGPDHLRAEYLGKFKKNSKKTVYKRGII